MHRVAALVLPVIVLAASGCADTEDGADSPIDAWQQVWDDADDELRADMCGTFHGEVPLHTGESGPEALYDALDEEGYVISLDYDDWHDWMEGECA